jgi:hypothetical protein
MNEKQKGILIVAAIVLGLMLFIPPWHNTLGGTIYYSLIQEHYNQHVNFTYLGLQVGVVILATIAGCLIFHGSNERDS